MKVIVTGGAGFIGSHIVDALIARGHQPFVIDDLSSGSPKNLPQGVPLFVTDLRHASRIREIFEEVRPDWVSHQAAQMSVSRSVREPVFDAEVNVLGLLNVFDSAATVGVKRIVFASSGGVLYGDVTTPTAEDYPAAPISPYGISKWVGEKYLEFFARERGLQGVALRYANVYGPRQNPHGEAGVVAIFCQKLLAGQAPTINGDGKYVRDYVYGPDVALANALALESTLPTHFDAFNIGTATPTDVNQLASCVRDQLIALRAQEGIQLNLPEMSYGPARAGDLRSSLVSPARAAAHLGWKPGFDLAQGLQETVRWFAAHAAQI
jgi:UDP-glucose 4-epimerase